MSLVDDSRVAGRGGGGGGGGWWGRVDDEHVFSCEQLLIIKLFPVCY